MHWLQFQNITDVQLTLQLNFTDHGLCASWWIDEDLIKIKHILDSRDHKLWVITSEKEVFHVTQLFVLSTNIACQFNTIDIYMTLFYREFHYLKS